MFAILNADMVSVISVALQCTTLQVSATGHLAQYLPWLSGEIVVTGALSTFE